MKFNADDEEYTRMLEQYERYVQNSKGICDDFDEWLETEYGLSRRKVIKRSIRKENKKEEQI